MGQPYQWHLLLAQISPPRSHDSSVYKPNRWFSSWLDAAAAMLGSRSGTTGVVLSRERHTWPPFHTIRPSLQHLKLVPSYTLRRPPTGSSSSSLRSHNRSDRAGCDCRPTRSPWHFTPPTPPLFTRTWHRTDLAVMNNETATRSSFPDPLVPYLSRGTACQSRVE